MTIHPSRRSSVVAVVIAWLVLVLAGLVLATSWLIEYPDTVLSVSWVVALTALTAVVIAAWRRSRSSGDSLAAALGKSLRAAGRFVLDFF